MILVQNRHRAKHTVVSTSHQTTKQGERAHNIFGCEAVSVRAGTLDYKPRGDASLTSQTSCQLPSCQQTSCRAMSRSPELPLANQAKTVLCALRPQAAHARPSCQTHQIAACALIWQLSSENIRQHGRSVLIVEILSPHWKRSPTVIFSTDFVFPGRSSKT